MVKAEWGTKRICKKCSATFYDLGRDPIVCPKCSSSFTPADFTSKYAKSSDKLELLQESRRLIKEDEEEIIVEGDLDNEELAEDEEDFDQDVGIIERPKDEEDR